MQLILLIVGIYLMFKYALPFLLNAFWLLMTPVLWLFAKLWEHKWILILILVLIAACVAVFHR